MASEREAGLTALREGNFDEAISLLRMACAENPSDFESHWYLGAACGMAGHHTEAVQALASAVHLRPAAAPVRYNLGVSLENAGFPEQALEAYRQALTLDSAHSSAADALRRLGHAPGRPSTVRNTVEIGPGWSAPDRPIGLTALPGSLECEPAADWNANEEPSGAPGFHSAAVAPTAALPNHGLLDRYVPSPHAPAGPTAVPETYTSELPPPNFNDEIDVPRAFQEFGRVLVSPNRFFREQASRTGMMSPILMVGLYLVIELVAGFLTDGIQRLVTFAVNLVFSPVTLAVAGAWMVVMYLITALVIHYLGWLFGNRQDFSKSFRACVYADAPRFLTTLIVAVYMAAVLLPALQANPLSTTDFESALGLPPGTMAGTPRPPSSPSVPAAPEATRPSAARSPKSARSRYGPEAGSPAALFRLTGLLLRKFGMMVVTSIAFGMIGWIWSTGLLVLGIHRLQRISAGAAAAVVLLMYMLAFLLVALIIFGFASIVIGLIGGALQSGGAVGGAH